MTSEVIENSTQNQNRETAKTLDHSENSAFPNSFITV